MRDGRKTCLVFLFTGKSGIDSSGFLPGLRNEALLGYLPRVNEAEWREEEREERGREGSIERGER